MIVSVAFLLLLLFGVNYYLTRSLLAPATLFCAAWTVNLVGLSILSGTFYPVSTETLMVYFVGALAFTAGGLLAEAYFQGKSQSTPLRTVSGNAIQSRRLLDLALLACLAGLPAYLRFVMDLIGGRAASGLLSYVRSRVVATSGETGTLDPVQNLPILTMIVAFCMVLENDGSWGRRIRAYLAVLLAVIYGLMLGAKGNTVIILLSVVFLVSLRHRIKARTWVIGFGAALLSFVIALFLVNFAFIHFFSAGEAIQEIASLLRLYWLGGLVGFDYVVRYPGLIEATQDFDRVFLQAANSLGANFRLPGFHAPFVFVSPAERSNVYTCYYSYFATYGWSGVVVLSAVTAAGLGVVYRWARQGSKIATVIYASMAVGLVLSFNGDHIFLNLNFCAKAFLFCALVYWSPVLRLLHRGAGMPRAAQALAATSSHGHA